MAQATLTIRVKVAWWVRPYLQLVDWCAWLTGRASDFERVRDACVRGIRVVR